MIRKIFDKIAKWLGYTSNSEYAYMVSRGMKSMLEVTEENLALRNNEEELTDKIIELTSWLQAEQEKFRVHKELTDKITDDFNALKAETLNGMLDQFVLKVNTLTKNDTIVVISTASVAMHDIGTFSKINSYLRTACPWLDLVFMVPKGYDFATMTRADLLDLGLMPIECPVTEEEIV